MSDSKRAPRPRRRSARPPQDRGELGVRMPAKLRAWLDYLVEVEGWGSTERLLQHTVRSLAESDESLCLDPTRSAFRAWLLKREGKTSRIRCGKDRLCRSCAARHAALVAWLAREDRREAVA